MENLSLDVRQLNHVCNGHPPEWCKRHHACLLMTHHPVSWLSVEARKHFESEIHTPPERFASHLFGHMHEHSLENVSKGGGQLRRHYQGASLFGLETFGNESRKRIHGYSLGELHIEKGVATLRFKPRIVEPSQNNTHRFIRDRSFDLDESTGFTRPDNVALSNNTSLATSEILQLPRSSSAPLPSPKISYGPSNPAFLVPFRAKGKFMVGRGQALERVRQQLVAGKPTNIGQTAVFQGIGGLGKTQLAVEYAYQYRDEYPNGVYWITADENIDAQLTRIAVEARWIAPETEHALKLAIARHRLRSYSDCLVVFDNLESVEAIREYLPESSANPHILVTSRREQPEFTDVKLDLLNENQSYQLLVQEAQAAPQNEMEEIAARDIADALNGLPLALELAGAYLARRSIGWCAYCELLRSNLKQALPARLASLTKHDADLFKTLRISEQEIGDEPLLTEVLDVLTWSGSSPMGLKLLAHLINVPQNLLYGALGLGAELRLLQKVPESERYVIHRLVQEVRRHDHQLVQRTEWACDIVQRMGDWFGAIREAFRELPAYEAEIEHLCAWQTHAASISSLGSARLLWLQAYPAYHRGRYKDSLDIVQKALAIYENKSLNNPDLRANLLNDFGYVSYATNGATLVVKNMWEEALHIRQDNLSKTHPEIADSLGNLASYHLRLGNTSLALALNEQALAMRRELFGDNHSDIANSLNNIATCYSQLGDVPRALELGQQALTMRHELLGDKHPDIANSLSNSATFHSKLGNKSRALELAQQALTMRRELLGDKHPDIALSLHNFANLHAKYGDSSRALELGEQALLMRRELLGESDSDTINSLQFVAKRLYASPFTAQRGKILVEDFLKHIPRDHPSRTKVLRFLNSRDGFRKPGKNGYGKKRKKKH